MKFMATWRVHPEKRQEVFETFSRMSAEDDGADHGEAIRVIGRWHDLARPPVPGPPHRTRAAPR